MWAEKLVDYDGGLQSYYSCESNVVAHQIK